jgi:hypothetical protein
MLDGLLMLVLSGVCAGVGIPAARLLPARAFGARLLLAPAFGTAILAVAVTLAYRFGVSPGTSLVVAGPVAVALVAAEVRAWLAGRRPDDAAEGRVLLVGAAAWLAALVVLALPRWVGGDQFSVFQGNEWDTFGYLESALVYARVPYDVVVAAGKAEFLRNPLFLSATRVGIGSRPSVMLLFAAFSGIASSESFRLHYAFLVALIAQAVPVAAFLVRSWAPRAPLAVVAAVGLAFALGFWGQYVFDLNAWSQIASVAPLLVAFGLLVEAGSLERPGLPRDAAPRLAAALGIVVAGATYLYPESLAYHLAVLVPLVAAAIALRCWRGGRVVPSRFVPLLGVGGVAAGFLFHETMEFALGQIAFGTGETVPSHWWRFFQAFFIGRDGVSDGSALGAIDSVAALVGLYFATPSEPDGLVAVLQRLALGAAILGLLAALTAALRRGPEREAPKELSPEAAETAEPGAAALSLSRLRLAALALAGLLLPAAVLLERESYWPAGKALSFVSPVLVLVLALPLASGISLRGWTWLRWVTAAFVAFQLATGIARVAAIDATGLHWAWPYPSSQEPERKEAIRWDVEPLSEALSGARRVTLAEMDPFFAHYLWSVLWARGVDAFQRGPIVTSFGRGENLGAMVPPWKGDALVAQAESGLVVLYADGRPPARVAWPQPER